MSATVAIAPVYQPIVNLDTGEVVGFEALARGTNGESASDLFATARTYASRSDLDWRCRCAALQGALDAGLQAPLTLFANAGASSLLSSAPSDVTELTRRAGGTMPLMLEVAERDLLRHPAELLAALTTLRRAGWGIAVDDVGGIDASLALLSVLRPDVIKLDLRLVERRTSSDLAEVVGAICAEAERSGALILAEGIETEQHEELAVALGAQLGQGFRFGRPSGFTVPPVGTGLPVPSPRESMDLDRSATPWSFVADEAPLRRSSRPRLGALARHLERQALNAGGVVFATVPTGPTAEELPASTAAHYAVLARHNPLVAVFAEQTPGQPADPVRSVGVEPADPLLAEWDVLVLGPQFAGGLIARAVPGDASNRYDYLLTHDRDVVVRAMRTMLPRIRPGRLPADGTPPWTPPASTDPGPERGPAADVAVPDAISNAVLLRAMRASPRGVTIAAADGDCPLVFVNDAFETLTGYRAADVLGRNCRLLQGPDTDAAEVRRVGDLLRRGQEVLTTLVNYRADGSPWWNELILAPILDEGGRLTHYVGIQEDVTSRVEADQHVRHRASHDALTGLANRALFEEHLAAEIERARTTGTSIALLYLDLDGFKAVNDELGHAVGDQLLRQVSDRWLRLVRAGDLLARHGGDEFLLVMSGMRNRPHRAATRVATALSDALHEPVEVAGRTLRVGASIGFAVYPDDGDEDASELLTRADNAMYREKRQRAARR